MQQAQKRAQWVYVQASASASGVDEVPNDAKGSATMKYIALYRVFKPDVSWPETTPRPPPVDTRAAEAAVGEAAGEAAGEDLSELIASLYLFDWPPVRTSSMWKSSTPEGATLPGSQSHQKISFFAGRIHLNVMI